MRSLIVGISMLVTPVATSAQVFLGKSANQWMAELKGQNPAARRSAAFSLGKLGQATPDVVEALRQALEGNDAKLQDAAAFALGELAADDADAVWSGAGRTLRDKLSNGDAAVRRSAAYALGCCGSRAREAEDDLVKALQTDTPELASVRQNTAWALGQLNRKAKQGQGAPAVTGLATLLRRKGEDPIVLRDVAGALGQIGRPAAESAAADLAGLAGAASDPAIRRMALNTLVNIVGPSIAKDAPHRRDAVLRELQKALRTGDPQFKGMAAAALGNLDEHGLPALRDLANLVADDRSLPEARRNAAIALGRQFKRLYEMNITDRAAAEAYYNTLLDEVKSDIVQKIARGMGEKEPVELRHHATEAIAYLQLRLLPDDVVRTLVKLIRQDPERQVRQNAIGAFMYREGSKDVPGLVEALTASLRFPNKMVAYNAARTLAYIQRGAASKEVIDTLDDMLHNKDLLLYHGTGTEVKPGGEGTTGQTTAQAQLAGDARFLASEALSFIGAPARRESIVKTLKEMTESKDERIKKYAREALTAMGL